MSKNVFPDNSTVFVKNGTTEFKVIGSTGDIYAGEVYVGNSSALKAIGSDGTLYNKTVPINFSEDATTTVNLKPYGVSILAASTAAGTMKKYTLDAPVKGVYKELVLSSTIAPMGSSDATQVMTGSSNINIVGFGTTLLTPDYSNIAMQTPFTYVRLLGLSTARWAMTDFKSASTNVTYTGLAGLSSGLSTGIAST